MLTFRIPGIPKPKQSARFRAMKVGAKLTVRSYQKAEVVQNQQSLAACIKSQLPQNFRPFSSALSAKVTFVYPPPKSMKKRDIAAIQSGQILYKSTRPDLVDNLVKGLFDSMNGLVFVDDALVCKTANEKIYGMEAMTIVEIGEITQDLQNK